MPGVDSPRPPGYDPKTGGPDPLPPVKCPAKSEEGAADLPWGGQPVDVLQGLPCDTSGARLAWDPNRHHALWGTNWTCLKEQGECDLIKEGFFDFLGISGTLCESDFSFKAKTCMGSELVSAWDTITGLWCKFQAFMKGLNGTFPFLPECGLDCNDLDNVPSRFEEDERDRKEMGACMQVELELLAPRTLTILEKTMYFPLPPPVMFIRLFIRIALVGGIKVDIQGAICVQELKLVVSLLPRLWMDLELDAGIDLLLAKAYLAIRATVVDMTPKVTGELFFERFPLSGCVTGDKINHGVTVRVYAVVERRICFDKCCITWPTKVCAPCPIPVWCEDKWSYEIKSLYYNEPDVTTRIFRIVSLRSMH